MTENIHPTICQSVVSGIDVLLNETQRAIMQGKICPYCKGKNIEIRHREQSFRCVDCKEGWAN